MFLSVVQVETIRCISVRNTRPSLRKQDLNWCTPTVAVSCALADMLCTSANPSQFASPAQVPSTTRLYTGRSNHCMNRMAISQGQAQPSSQATPPSNSSEVVLQVASNQVPVADASPLGNSEPNSLLGTAQAFLRDRWGHWTSIRLVIDCGSQSNLITADCAKRLGLPLIRPSTHLCGPNEESLGQVHHVVDCVLTSRFANKPVWVIQAAVHWHSTCC